MMRVYMEDDCEWEWNRYNSPHLNEMCLHPRFMQAVGQLLKVPVDEIRLTQSMVGGKAGTPIPVETEAKGWGNKRGDQPIHLVRRLQTSASQPVS